MADDNGDTRGDTKSDDIAFIAALAALLRDSDLSEVEVKREQADQGELRVRLSRASAPVAPAPVYAPAPMPSPAQPSPSPVAAAALEDPADHPGAITSPMVGTIYVAPEPSAAPFVRVGDTVDEGQTLLIIEAMKTMNQIPAPHAGTVRRILIEDKQPVEFGAPLMIIE
jgi:acetyl-CoA carboxylase biotin carboxyl carrier protein